MKVKRILDKRAATIMGLSYVFLTLSTCIKAITVKRRTRVRRFGVRPMNRKRNSEGTFATLIKDMLCLEWDEDQFIKYTRMTKAQFLHLHHLIFSHIKKCRRKHHIATEQRLIMTIHYLSEGCSMQEIGWNYRTGKTIARNIIKETCEALWNVLYPIVLPVPRATDFIRISNEFVNRWNLPNCIGAVDGKHVIIRAPKKSGSEFFNCKQSFSIVLMASCDAYCRFTMVDIGSSGGNHDSAVFKQSGFGHALLNKQLDMPPVKPLPNTNILFPHFVVADAAFPLHENMNQQSKIESSFGILSQRWQILRGPIHASVEVCELIVQATVVLHNYLQNCETDIPPAERKYCPTGFADYINNNGEVQLGRWREGPDLRSVSRIGSNNATNAAKNQRDLLADYFVSPQEMVHWQESYVNRGGLPTN